VRFALACNRSGNYPTGENRPEDEFEEFDSPQTVQAIAEAIESFGHKVKILEADKTFPAALSRGKFDIVFNIAEGLSGRAREAQVPAVCEMLGIPYVGSDPVTLGVTLDKNLAKSVLSGIVPVPKGRLIRNESEIDLSDFTFPVFVKPNAEGSSKGIRNSSRIDNLSAAVERIRSLLQEYRGAVLVEEFLEGPECTVGILGNASPRIVAAMEIAPKIVPNEYFVYSLETKRDFKNQVEYHVPPRLFSKQSDLLYENALKAFVALDCRDFARIDFRFDRHGIPKFVEANPLPGLAPEKSDFVILAQRVGIEHAALIGAIVKEALTRLGISS